MDPKCSGQMCSFEYRAWKVKAKKTTIMVIAIYHPPYTAKSPALMPCSLMISQTGSVKDYLTTKM